VVGLSGQAANKVNLKKRRWKGDEKLLLVGW